MTTLRHPPLPDPSQASLSPLAQVRGCGRNCVGIQGPCLFLLPFLGAAWAKPTKERDREGGESERKGGCPLSLTQLVTVQPHRSSHSPLPPRLGGQPHTGKMEPLDGTLGKEEDGRSRTQGPGGGGRGKKRTPPTLHSPPHPLGILPYSIPWENS